MADTPDPESPGAQHNHGPGLFIAGNVQGPIYNIQAPQQPPSGPEPRPRVFPYPPHTAAAPYPHLPRRADTRSPGAALLGWGMLTLLLFGVSVYAFVDAIVGTGTGGDRAADVLIAVVAPLGGLLTSALALAATTEICAAVTANAAGLARKPWTQNQEAPARFTLRYALVATRVAVGSAIAVGFVTGLYGFVPACGKAAERAHKARERAESELTETRMVLGPAFDRT